LDETGNLGEMADADAVGTVGSPDCGDMVRMWIKYRDEDGRRVIDKASFQSFGCQTAIAVASAATKLIQGKTREEALAMDATALSAPVGPLPPMKIHCGQMVEGALKAALDAARAETQPAAPATPRPPQAQTLADSLQAAKPGKIKITFTGLLLALGMLASPSAEAQVVPATPRNFGMRSLGSSSQAGGVDAGAAAQRPAPEVRQVSYFSLGEARQWTSSDGRSLVGKLIAWEEHVQVLTATPGQAAPAAQPAPELPAKPTVIKDGQVRLLVGQKAFELALDRLSETDREHVEEVRQAIEKAAAAKAAAAAP
jgi:nitrogen fixation NifU-like protein